MEFDAETLSGCHEVQRHFFSVEPSSLIDLYSRAWVRVHPELPCITLPYCFVSGVCSVILSSFIPLYFHSKSVSLVMYFNFILLNYTALALHGFFIKTSAARHPSTLSTLHIRLIHSFSGLFSTSNLFQNISINSIFHLFFLTPTLCITPSNLFTQNKNSMHQVG